MPILYVPFSAIDIFRPTTANFQQLFIGKIKKSFASYIYSQTFHLFIKKNFSNFRLWAEWRFKFYKILYLIEAQIELC